MKNLNKIAICGVILLAVGFGWGVFHKELTGDKVFDCDGKVVSLNTKIDVNNGEYIIEGNVLRLWEDPLTISDNKGNKRGTAGDNYDFITQDDHVIKTENGQLIMKGNFSPFSDRYEIVKNDETIAYAKYNMFDTKGTIESVDGEIISRYSSFIFMRDFEVSFNSNEILSEEEVLLIHASYYSDKVFDQQLPKTKK